MEIGRPHPHAPRLPASPSAIAKHRGVEAPGLGVPKLDDERVHRRQLLAAQRTRHDGNDEAWRAWRKIAAGGAQATAPRLQRLRPDGPAARRAI
ncbi:MAG: hypothetical protein MZV70_15975 [Desulfobacterales bacterium]|nr:hypothetical protein [Desulfobacterales bacterium]